MVRRFRLESLVPKPQPVVPEPLASISILPILSSPEQSVIVSQIVNRLSLFRNKMLDNSVRHPPSLPARRNNRRYNRGFLTQGSGASLSPKFNIIEKPALLPHSHHVIGTIGNSIHPVQLTWIRAQL